jgi:hypothetical protein
MKRFLFVLFFATAYATASWANIESEVTDDTTAMVQPQADVETSGDNAAAPDTTQQSLAETIKAAIRDSIAEATAYDQEIIKLELGVPGDDDADWGDWEGNIGVGESIVAILAILFIFGTPIMLVVVVLYALHRKRRLAVDMASKFLASDQPVPPEVWQGLAGNTSPRSNLHKGMIMLGVGVGVFLSFWLMGAMEAAYLALIPLFIGIAQLLIWNLEKHKASPKE